MALVSVGMRIIGSVVFLILNSTIYAPQSHVSLTSHSMVHSLVHLLIHRETNSYGVTPAGPALCIWTAYSL